MLRHLQCPHACTLASILRSCACHNTPCQYAATVQVFAVFVARLEADNFTLSVPADLDALDACTQQLAQVSGRPPA